MCQSSSPRTHLSIPIQYPCKRTGNSHVHVKITPIPLHNPNAAHRVVKVAADVVQVGTVRVAGDEGGLAAKVLVFEDVGAGALAGGELGGC
jgi:hypothetical protein